jgi:NTE family protein
MKPKKIGLVLAGGGGKGAYQLGVWKFFKEIGLDEHIEVISGTSVGALNAILFSLENYENCEKIWKDKIKEKILLKNENHQSIKKQIERLLVLTCSSLGGWGLFLVKDLIKNGFFSRDGLLDIINSIDISQLRKCKKTIYATCTEVPSCKAISFKLNNRNTNDMKKILLATSALPGVFKIEQIDGKTYYDGGLTDNVPKTPLIMESCTHHIIIYLKNDVTDLPNNEKIIISPSKDLGNIISGTLNFETSKISELIALGYKDASKYRVTLERLFHPQKKAIHKI